MEKGRSTDKTLYSIEKSVTLGEAYLRSASFQETNYIFV